MIRAFPVFRLVFLPVITLCSLISCSSSSGIDNYFTFNERASHDVALDNALFQRQPVTVPISISIDSAEYAKNGTTLSLVKSIKLNSLKLVSGDGSYPFSKIDTLTFSVQADSIGSQVLATYSGSADNVTYTNADFAQFLKGRNATFMLSMSTANPPPGQFSFTVSTTNVLTAGPQQ
ncbi:MAG: hypothetical protein ACHQM6_10035 [Candidatus Kapaibacterium sp.]